MDEDGELLLQLLEKVLQVLVSKGVLPESQAFSATMRLVESKIPFFVISYKNASKDSNGYSQI